MLSPSLRAGLPTPGFFLDFLTIGRMFLLFEVLLRGMGGWSVSNGEADSAGAMQGWLCAIKVRRKWYPVERKAFGKAEISFLMRAGLALVINGRMGWIWISGWSWKQTWFFFFSPSYCLYLELPNPGVWAQPPPVPGLFLPGSHQDFKLNFFYRSLPAVSESWKKKMKKKKKRKIPISPSWMDVLIREMYLACKQCHRCVLAAELFQCFKNPT